MIYDYIIRHYTVGTTETVSAINSGDIFNLTLTREISGESTLLPGGCVSAMITGEISGSDTVNHIAVGDEIVLYSSSLENTPAAVDPTTLEPTDPSATEFCKWNKIGIFYVQKVNVSSSGRYSFEAYDSLCKLDKNVALYIKSNWVDGTKTSKTIFNILYEFCTTVCGVGVRAISSTFPVYDFPGYNVPIPTNCFDKYDDWLTEVITARQIVVWLAELCGCYAFADADGNVCFTWTGIENCGEIFPTYEEVTRSGGSSVLFEDVSMVIDKSYDSEFTFSTPDVETWTGKCFALKQGGYSCESYWVDSFDYIQIKALGGDRSYYYPESPAPSDSSKIYTIEENRFVCNMTISSNTKYLVQLVYAALNGGTTNPYGYYPFSASVVTANSWVDMRPGFFVGIFDYYGNAIRTLVTKMVRTANGFTFSADGDETGGVYQIATTGSSTSGGGSGGSGGTTNYNNLSNKPQINSVELSGDKSSHDDLSISEVYVQTTEPTDPIDGDIWVNPDATATIDYGSLDSKPQINGVTLVSNKTAVQLGLLPLTAGASAPISDALYASVSGGNHWLIGRNSDGIVGVGNASDNMNIHGGAHIIIDPTAIWLGAKTSCSTTTNTTINAVSVLDSSKHPAIITRNDTQSKLAIGNYGTDDLYLRGHDTRPKYESSDSSSESLALLSDVPTNTSDLTNDSGFITSSSLADYLPLSAGNDKPLTGTLFFGGNGAVLQSGAGIKGAHGSGANWLIGRNDTTSVVGVGNTSDAMYIRGSGVRPIYENTDGSVGIALLSDISGISGSFKVTIEKGQEGYESDKTNAEIYAAYQAGKTVYVHMAYEDQLLQAISVTSTKADFCAAYGYNSNTDIWITALTIENDDISAEVYTMLKSGDLSAYRTAAAQNAIDALYLPLAGGDLTGDLYLTDNKGILRRSGSVGKSVIAWNDTDSKIAFGNTVDLLRLRGSEDRPVYEKPNAIGSGTSLALYSDIPTKTSELTNDSGFLTSHQSLSAYRTASEQDDIDDNYLLLTGGTVSGDIILAKDSTGSFAIRATDGGGTVRHIARAETVDNKDIIYLGDGVSNTILFGKTVKIKTKSGSTQHTTEFQDKDGTVALLSDVNTDYDNLDNRPSINSVTLTGNKTSTQLGLAAESHTHTASDITSGLATVATSGSYEDLSNRPKYNSSTITKDTNIPEVKTSTWDAKYSKPSGGIPKSDLATSVQNVLDGVDEHIDDTSIHVSTEDRSYWNGKADASDIPDVPDIPSSDNKYYAIYNESWEALSSVAKSGSYNDLSNKPTIPTVNDGVLTIRRNNVSLATFSANDDDNVNVNISVPTNTSELTNDSGFLTEHQSLSAYRTASAQDTIDATYLPLSGGTVTGQIKRKYSNTEYNLLDTSMYYSSNPKMDGTASTGSSNNYARGDHVHPSDTSKSDVGHTHSASEVSGLAAVATSGNFNQLSNVPTINGVSLMGAMTSSDLALADKVHTHDNASTSSDGFMSKEDKTKLNGIATGATANTGTVTSVAVKMNGSLVDTVTTSGTIDLGTVLTSHQDISGKQDKEVLLWTNSSPTSTFTAQTVTVANLSNYSKFRVVYRWATTAASSQKSCEFVKGSESTFRGCCDIVDVFNGGMRSRRFSIVSTAPNDMVWEVGYAWVLSSGSSSTGDGVIIPLYVYGIA